MSRNAEDLRALTILGAAVIAISGFAFAFYLLVIVPHNDRIARLRTEGGHHAAQAEATQAKLEKAPDNDGLNGNSTAEDWNRASHGLKMQYCDFVASTSAEALGKWGVSLPPRFYYEGLDR